MKKTTLLFTASLEDDGATKGFSKVKEVLSNLVSRQAVFLPIQSEF